MSDFTTILFSIIATAYLVSAYVKVKSKELKTAKAIKKYSRIKS